MTRREELPIVVVPHFVEDGDGVCGDCFWCQENTELNCIVPSDPKCHWCDHCLGNHDDERS
jgi:hypothetical protein